MNLNLKPSPGNNAAIVCIHTSEQKGNNHLLVPSEFTGLFYGNYAQSFPGVSSLLLLFSASAFWELWSRVKL